MASARWLGPLVGLAVMAALLSGVPAAAVGDPAIVFDDQRTSGRVLLVDAVRLPEPGFVAVHDPGAGEGDLGPVVGQSIMIGAGMHNFVPVVLTENVTEPRTLIAVLYQDSNDNRAFDHPDGHGHAHDHAGQDDPYRVNETTIGDEAEIAPYDLETDEGGFNLDPLLAGTVMALASIVLWAVRYR